MLGDFNTIKKDILDYLEVRLDLIKLHTAENISKILSKVVNIAIIGFLMVFIFLFLSFAAGYFFAEHFQSNKLGFLCVAGIYLILLIVFLLTKKQIVERPIIKSTIKLFFPKKSNDEKI
jgi:Putative Actinobacterial Holin-X, holin superfamily III